jgi:hypothetical protein
MAALAEVQWLQPQDKNFQDFKARLFNLVELYKHYCWTYRAKSLLQDDDDEKVKND